MDFNTLSGVNGGLASGAQLQQFSNQRYDPTRTVRKAIADRRLLLETHLRDLEAFEQKYEKILDLPMNVLDPIR